MPTQRKRKATEESDEGKSAGAETHAVDSQLKVSKKQRREEAKARARAWALQEKQTPVPKVKVSTATNIPDLEERLKSPTKRRKLDSSTLLSPDQPKKLSKKEQLEEARLRAQIWANETKSPTPKESAVIKTATQTSPSPPHRKDSARNTGVKSSMKAPKTEVFCDQEMQDATEEAIYQEVIGAKNLEAKSQPGDIAAGLARPRNPIATTFHFTEQTIMQEQIDLEKKIQDQVLANVTEAMKAHKKEVQKVQYVPPSQQLQHSDVAQKPDTPLQQQQYNKPQQHDERKKRPLLTVSLSILIAIGVVVLGLLAKQKQSITDGADVLARTGPTKLPPCYFSEESYESDATHDEIKCNRSMEMVPCPIGAICMNGAIRFCVHHYHVVAATGDMCVLSVDANATLDEIQETLIAWTVEDTCSLQGCEFARRAETNGPLFPISKFPGHVDALLLEKSTNIVLTRDEVGEILVGLTDNYMENELVLPWLCWLCLMMVQLVKLTSMAFIRLVGSGGFMVWSVSMAYPWVSFACLVVLWTLRTFRQRQAAHKVLLADVAKVRQLTYQKLMDDDLQHVVLHLRDDIALDLYPISKTGREYLIHKVWPRVVADVRCDNRVHKTNQLLQGKPRDVWKWVATPSKRVK